MNANWETIRLGEVLRRSEETIEPLADAEYRQVTVRLWGNGVVERGRARGSELSGRRFVAHHGQFIASRIDARNGAMGLVPASLEGALVTNDFPLFNLKTERISPTYLQWLSRTNWFVELCERASEGTTNRVRLKEDRLLGLEVSIPPLADQNRIVHRVELLATQIEEACTLGKQVADEAEALLLSQIADVFSRLEGMHEVRSLGSFSPHVTSGPRNWAKHYDRNGARFYRAQDIGPDGAVLDDSKVFVVPPPGEQGRTAMLQTGDLMLVITGATVGRVSLFRNGLEPGFVSQHVGICRLPQSEIDPDFALWGLRGPSGQEQILGQRYGQGKPGLNLENIRAIALPYPPLGTQREVVADLNALQRELQRLRVLQADRNEELSALLPSILGTSFQSAG